MPRPFVLVIREDSRFAAVLRQSGIGVECLPLIRTEPVADPGLLIEKLEKLEEYDGIFLTSRSAAAELLRHGIEAASVFSGKFYVLGNQSKSIFDEAGIAVEYFASANTAVELLEQLGVSEFSGKRLLFVRGNRSMRTIPAMLGTVAEVDEVIVYNTIVEIPPDMVLSDIRERLRNGQIDWICFFSPSGVESFVRYFGNELKDGTKIASIGETTALAARSASLNVEFVSPKSDAAVFASELSRFITKNEQ